MSVREKGKRENHRLFGSTEREARRGASPEAWTQPAFATDIVSLGEPAALHEPDEDTQLRRRPASAVADARRAAMKREFRDVARLAAEVRAPRVHNVAPLGAPTGTIRESQNSIPSPMPFAVAAAYRALPGTASANAPAEQELTSGPVPPPAASIAVRSDQAVGLVLWALVLVTTAIALPAGVLVGRALTSRPVAAPPAPPPTDFAPTAPERHDPSSGWNLTRPILRDPKTGGGAAVLQMPKVLTAQASIITPARQSHIRGLWTSRPNEHARDEIIRTNPFDSPAADGRR